jgi:hypothetical protein
MPVTLPVFYTVNGSAPMPVPSTGMFSSMGKQSTAGSKQEAIAKARAAKINVPPGSIPWGADIQKDGIIVFFQSGGKRKKSRRKTRLGRKTRRNKSRRSRGK